MTHRTVTCTTTEEWDKRTHVKVCQEHLLRERREGGLVIDVDGCGTIGGTTSPTAATATATASALASVTATSAATTRRTLEVGIDLEKNLFFLFCA